MWSIRNEVVGCHGFFVVAMRRMSREFKKRTVSATIVWKVSAFTCWLPKITRRVLFDVWCLNYSSPRNLRSLEQAVDSFSKPCFAAVIVEQYRSCQYWYYPNSWPFSMLSIFFPLSEIIIAGYPLLDTKRLIASEQLSVSRLWQISKCTARFTKHVKMQMSCFFKLASIILNIERSKIILSYNYEWLLFFGVSKTKERKIRDHWRNILSSPSAAYEHVRLSLLRMCDMVFDVQYCGVLLIPSYWRMSQPSFGSQNSIFIQNWIELKKCIPWFQLLSVLRSINCFSRSVLLQNLYQVILSFILTAYCISFSQNACCFVRGCCPSEQSFPSWKFRWFFDRVHKLR